MKNLASKAAAYEVLGPEYYDPIRHPTCANFRRASQQLIRSWFEKYAGIGAICEVGAGMSIVADLLIEKRLPLASLLLTDSARSMLRHSDKWIDIVGDRAHSVVAEASALPFPAGTIGLAVCSLGDPYNERAFWTELARIVMAGGYVIFTTPSHEWATRYRAGESGGSDSSVAEFILADGRAVYVPSMIYSQGHQEALIAAGGLMEVVKVKELKFSELPAAGISPKLLVTKEKDLPVLTGYLARRV